MVGPWGDRRVNVDVEQGGVTWGRARVTVAWRWVNEGNYQEVIGSDITTAEMFRLQSVSTYRDTAYDP